MSAHWRLAFWYTAWVSAGATLIGSIVWFLFGGTYAVAFLYGAGVGIVSFASTAITVSLLTGRFKVLGVIMGAASFVVRYGFVAVALGVPAYLDLWPVVAMLISFVGVYLAENVVLLPRVLIGKPNAGRQARARVERRAEA